MACHQPGKALFALREWKLTQSLPSSISRSNKAHEPLEDRMAALNQKGGVEGATLHDLRHQAITEYARRDSQT
jgi:hypothetical protein